MSDLHIDVVLDIADVPSIRTFRDTAPPVLTLGEQVFVTPSVNDTPAQRRDVADRVLAAVTEWRDAVHQQGRPQQAPEVQL